jgi:hypothetical protein
MGAPINKPLDDCLGYYHILGTIRVHGCSLSYHYTSGFRPDAGVFEEGGHGGPALA